MLAKCTNQPNAPDWTGWTPLRIATAKGLRDIMKFLASCSDNQCWGCSQYGSKERFKTYTFIKSNRSFTLHVYSGLFLWDTKLQLNIKANILSRIKRAILFNKSKIALNTSTISTSFNSIKELIKTFYFCYRKFIGEFLTVHKHYFIKTEIIKECIFL